MRNTPRLSVRVLPRLARGALLAVSLLAASSAAGLAEPIAVSATYSEPTTRYAHGVLGDAVEYGALKITQRTGKVATVRLPNARVFEDIAPRLLDVTGDGAPEVVVVETHKNTGAQLAIYDATGQKIAATPHIGRTNRWLAPIGAADLDGDGHIEIAYIDRPHLAKTLRIWRFKDGSLREVAALEGLTNHKIGWDFIAGGLRLCANKAELITADAGWQSIMATRLTAGKVTARRIGAYDGPESLTKALSCP